MGDTRNDDDLVGFIRSILTGQLEDEKDLDDATEMFRMRSDRSFLYMASMAAKFRGDMKWKMAELVEMPAGLDSKYCENFSRILAPKWGPFPYDVDKVSEWYCSVVTQYFV